MKKTILVSTIISLVAIFSTVSIAEAYVSVHGYYKSNGTYVAPYVRSNPNGLKYDNYGYTPSQGLYNASYGTKGATWDTPTYVTDPNYYLGKSLYESGSTGTGGSLNYYPTTYNTSPRPQVIAPANATIYGSDWYCNTGYKTVFNNSFQKVSCSQV